MNYRLLSFLAFIVVGYGLSAADGTLALGAEVVEGVGQDWSLPDGQVVNLQIVDQNFHLLFLDPDRLIIAPTIEKVIVRGEGVLRKSNKLNLVTG